MRAGLEVIPERRIASAEAFAQALGATLHATGSSLALTVESAEAPRSLLESVVRAAASVFDAAAVSVALRDPYTGELRAVTYTPGARPAFDPVAVRRATEAATKVYE